jgi:hypothetical protein
MKRALWVGGLCGLLSVGCSQHDGSSSGGDAGGGAAGGSDGGTPATSADSLVGTWDLTTTPVGTTDSIGTTVTIGQNSLTVTSPDFILTATRTGNALTFTDEQEPGDPSQNITLTATQTAATFNAGILPFDLSGSWTMQIVQMLPAGPSTVETCTLTVSATEIDGSCQETAAESGLDFGFTTAKMTPAASSLGDFGGTWLNTWIGAGTDGGIVTFPCALDFAGNDITTCPVHMVNGYIVGSPVTGISFTYDGADTVSGVAQGWAEYSATRQ